MDTVKVGNYLELIIVGLLVLDVLLEWKMVYGVYPWEGQANT
jgi:hypothetical protein